MWYGILGEGRQKELSIACMAEIRYYIDRCARTFTVDKRTVKRVVEHGKLGQTLRDR